MTARPVDHKTIEITCPPWCAGHQGNYQAWEDFGNNDFHRDHADVPNHDIRGVAVSLNQVQRSRQGFLPPQIELWAGNETVVLTSAAEARALAAVLLSAAEQLEANR